MFNQVFLIGRATDKPSINKLENGQTVGHITIAVNRPYKNQDGNFDTDFLTFTLWNAVAQSANSYCNKGSLVGIRGIVIQKEETVLFKKDDENLYKKIKTYDLVGENVTFLKL
ncbi:MAG: single-stranded DNA-binding protein [Bacilli bacterium]|nr:single-stranded DNA-binding protein [Bacilli bacterium]